MRTGSDFIAHQNRFITALFGEKRYFDCIGETGRLLLHTHDHYLRKEYSYFISMNYYLGKQFATVITRTEAAERAPQHSLRTALLRSYSFVNPGHLHKALSPLMKFSYSSLPKDRRDELLVRKTEILVLQGKYPEVLQEISRYKKSAPLSKEIDNLRKDIARFSTVDRKSAAAAAALSAIIPGTGQAYSGKYRQALLSFAAIALGSAGTWYAAEHGEKPTAMTIGFFTALMYAGNIYGAWNAASDFNRRHAENFRSGIISSHITPYNPESYIDMDRVFP